MTLLASFSIDSQPILLGDLALSLWREKWQTSVESQEFHIPTIRDVNQHLPEEWGVRIVGLRQKVVLLHEHFALAWAGSVSAAARACKVLESELATGPLPLSGIVGVLDSLLVKECGEELFIIGLLVSAGPEPGTHTICRFAWDSSGANTEPQSFGPFGSAYLGGSGFGNARKVLASIAESPLRFSRATDPLQTAALAGISITTLLSGEQLHLGVGLAELYGGGFEVATVKSGRIEKIGGITHYFIEAMRLESGSIKVIFRRAISYDYHGTILVVGTVELDWEVQWSPTAPGNEQHVTCGLTIPGAPATYLIFPVHKPPTQSERSELLAAPPQPSFCSPWTSLFLNLPARGNERRSIVHYSGSASPAVCMAPGADSTFQFTISTEVLSKIEQALGNFAAEPPNAPDAASYGAPPNCDPQ